MSSVISGSVSAIRLSRKQDGQGGVLGAQDSWVVFLARAAPRGRQGAFLTRLRLAVNQLSPNFLCP